jgi:hypothetical protein
VGGGGFGATGVVAPRDSVLGVGGRTATTNTAPDPAAAPGAKTAAGDNAHEEDAGSQDSFIEFVLVFSEQPCWEEISSFVTPVPSGLLSL